MTQPVLTTDRLVLRPFRNADIDPLHGILSDPRVMRFWGDRHTTREDTEAFVRGTIRADPANTCDFVITRDDLVIGKAGMWKKPEIGFFLHPGHQRQGLAREALVAVIAHLLDTYDVPALTADVDPDNARSLAVLQAMGFAETHRATRTMQIEGRWCDSVYLALKRPA